MKEQSFVYEGTMFLFMKEQLTITDDLADFLLGSLDLLGRALDEELLGGGIVGRVLVHLHVGTSVLLHPVDSLSFLGKTGSEVMTSSLF